MNKNTQYIVYVFLLILVGFFGMKYFKQDSEKSELIVKIEKLKMDSDTIEMNKCNKIDINRAEKKDFFIKKVSEKRTENIIEFRKFWGKIENMDDLTFIKGIGAKTVEKLKEDFYVDETNSNEVVGVLININKVKDNELVWLGLDKKELENFKKWKNEKGIVFSNLDLMKIIKSKTYEKIKNKIVYMDE
ncbi:MAG: hypothetical protein B6I28_02730 [Fusobacteriia bacterium 4572_132]|nr:MAG: hypothetical protein B6I28_02730 [Fusobacteriia bacterium 4572_132]